MTQETNRGLPSNVRLPHEALHHSITPFFKHMSVLNVAQSETAGKAIYDLMEVVELRFAGDRNYSPVFPSDAMSYRNGLQVVTFAERFSEQYRDFVAGGDQRSGGTALEALTDFGITPAQLSICRALKVYSVEALHALDGPNLKNLGMSANELKSMARQYMDGRSARAINETTDDMASLRAEIARLSSLIPVEEPTAAEVDAALIAADAEYATLTDAELKSLIKDRTGQAPRGTPSRETLLASVKELAA